MKTEKNKETIPIASRITESMQKAIEIVLTTDGHLNMSDYVRDLIRNDLTQRGLLKEASVTAYQATTPASKPPSRTVLDNKGGIATNE